MEKYNTKFKVYPDGNFIAITANRPFFMTPQARLALREYREQQHLEYLEKSKRIIECIDIFQANHPELAIERKKFFASAGLVEGSLPPTNPLLESLIAKAKEMRIPVNGVTYFSKDGKAPKKGNIRRAKDMIFDLIYLNDFDYFATLTFNPDKVDSFNPDEVMKKVKKWLNNHQTRNGLKYVLVPEYHVSGRIHMHMLYSGNLKLVDSGHVHPKTGQTIYNCSSWSFGFSTVVRCDDNRAKLAFYVSKYVTKDVQRIFGKYYYSSQGLKRECPVEYGNRSFADVKSPSVHVDALDIRFKYESSIQFNSVAEENSQSILDSLGVIK